MPLTHFQCPAALAAKGYCLDPETAEHRPFLRGLFASLREAQLALLPLDENQKRDFLDTQFDFQQRHYLSQYPSPSFLVLGGPGGLVGRLYLAEDDRGGVRILDITMHPECRGQGIGAALIGGLQEILAPRGLGISLHVEKINPAQRLYLRLGFRVTEDGGYFWRMDWP